MATRARRVTVCQPNHSQWQDEIEGIPLLESTMKLFSVDTLICCIIYSCRTNGSVCRHGMMLGDCPFLTYSVSIA